MPKAPDKNSADSSGGEICRACEVLFEPDSVVELRAFKGPKTVSGYFDGHEALTGEAAKLDSRGFAVYVILNEVQPALLARAANRAREVGKGDPTTSDADIRCRRWLPLDFDPVRPSGVSATDKEKKAALLRAREVRDYLRGQGWPEPVVADSGNGAHLLYRIDLPNDRESLQLIKGVLEALAFKFSDEAVSVDTATGNAARIWKLYGTIARKGDHTEERPHRRSRVLKVPEEDGNIEVASREMLEEVAAMRPAPPPRKEPYFGSQRNGHKEFDLEAWIGEHGVLVRREGEWGRGGYRWVLEECPWNGHTDNSAYIIRFENGAIAAGCHHNSCHGYGWRELREHYEPGAYERREHYGSYKHTVAIGSEPEDTGILLSEVEAEQVEWLWRGWLALGKLALIDGDPGLGKSAATLDLAARVSSGRGFPDGAGCEPGGVVLLSAEDGLSDTIRPRLDAAGANTSRILALATVLDENGHSRLLSVPEDLEIVERGIERVGARLVVVDPLMAFLSGEANSHRDQDVRRALAPLAALAERPGAAILVVRHLNKTSVSNPLYRGGGSIGIIGAARMGFVVAKDPHNEERRVLAPTKNNLTRQSKSLTFTLEEASNGAVRVIWGEESELSARELLASPADQEEGSALDEAVGFLRSILSKGPVPASRVKAEAEESGISEKTLYRAKKALGVAARREGEAGKQGGGRWVWALPMVKLVKTDGWPSKLATPADNHENPAYLSQKLSQGLDSQGLDGQVSFGHLHSATSSEPRYGWVEGEV